MQTHYIRRFKKLGLSSKVDCPEESYVLEAIPKDRLVTLSEIPYLVQVFCEKQKEKCPHFSTIENWVKKLVEKRFVVEIYGPKLEKLLENM